MTFGLTPEGFILKRLPDIKNDLDESLIAEFGDVNLTPQSVFGQIVGVFSKPMADSWENQEAVYNSQYPATAEGTSLDNVVQLNGITRLPATRTTVYAVCQGIEGTLISLGSLARQPDSGQVFQSIIDDVISYSNAVQTTATLDLLDEQSYNLVINGNIYTYSLPTITFTGSFVTGNSIEVTLNNVTLPAVPFNTDNDTTLSDIATQIALFVDVQSAVDTAPSTIDITPNDGVNVVVNSINITGGISQPTSAITYRVPYAILSFDIDFVASNSLVITINDSDLSAIPFNTDQATTALDIKTALEALTEVDSVEISGSDRVFKIIPTAGEILTVNSAVTTGGVTQPTATIINPVFYYLSQIINAGEIELTTTDNNNSTMLIKSDDASDQFSISAGTNILLSDLSSSILFEAQIFGPIPCPIGSLTEILTPIAGWNSVDNWEAGVLGRNLETDSELRLRRRNSIKLLGNATVEAIRAKILQNVSGVTQAFVYENKTMKQENLTLIFSEDLVTGNQITITINQITLPVVNFSVDHITTMGLIATEIETQTQVVFQATVGGTGNREIEIEAQWGAEFYIDVVVTGGASQANVTQTGGRVPKSFEAVVQGGSDEDIANEIWFTKPAGIQTFGNTLETITDSQGELQPIYFSRPTPIYIWVRVELTLYSEETFPTNGLSLVAQAIKNYGDSLQVGEDVLLQRVNAQIFNVSGIASGDMEIAFTYSENDSPTYATNDISIEEVQLSNWDLSRINITLAP